MNTRRALPGKAWVVGYGLSWHGYYGGGAFVAGTRGYAGEFKEVTFETAIFDTATNEPVWSAFSSTTEIRDSDTVLSYVREIGRQLADSDLFE